jgi:hypothetical protein
MGIILEKVALWQIVYRILQLSPVSEIPPMLSDNVSFTYNRSYSVAILPTSLNKILVYSCSQRLPLCLHN